MKLHEIHTHATTVPRNLQKINHTTEARRTRELRRDVIHPYLDQRSNDDKSVLNRVAVTNPDPRLPPDANAGGDVAAANAIAQSVG